MYNIKNIKLKDIINTDLNYIITRLVIASMVHRYFLYFKIKLLKFFQKSSFLIKYLAKDKSKSLFSYDLNKYELTLEVLAVGGILSAIILDRMKIGTYMLSQVGYSILVVVLFKKVLNLNILGLVVYFIFIFMFYICIKLFHNYLIKNLITESTQSESTQSEKQNVSSGDNSCTWAFDGICDDGSTGNEKYCELDTDFSDCNEPSVKYSNLRNLFFR